MDPQTDLPDLVEDLEVNIDELTTALEPLLSTPLHTTASSLPLLDKAELYCMSAYAIEAILFSVLKASGVNAMEHDVFKEIARLKQYNSKIKDIKDRGIMGSAEGRARLDVGAAQRFIKHGLAGNDRYDLERKERIAKEKARAHLKAQKINKKFDDEGREMESKEATPKKRGVDEVDHQEEYSDSDNEVLEDFEETEPATKKARVDAADTTDIDSGAASSSQAISKKQKNKETRAKKTKLKTEKKATQSAESTDADADQNEDDMSEPPVTAGKSQPEPGQETDTPQPKKRGRPPKKDKKTAKAKQDPDTIDVATPSQDTDAEATPSRAEERVTRRRNKRLSTQNSQEEESVVPTPDRAPKTRSETFSALLDGSLSEKQKKGTSGRGNRRGGKGRAK